MDIAASEFAKDVDGAKKYDLDFKNPKSDKSKWVSNSSNPNHHHFGVLI